MTKVESEHLIISEEETGERLDKILVQRFQGAYSRTYFQYLINEHLVLINGIPIKKRVRPQPGDEIEIQFVLSPELELLPESIPLNILYEDESLLVVNKPVGMVVHPAPGHWSGTFVNALLYHCRMLPKSNGLRPGIVHRLDKDTSGVLIAAKTGEAQQKLTEMFAARKVYKEYLSICIGNPGNIHIDAPIGRHPVLRKQMAIVEGGRNALTTCQTLKTDGRLSLVKVVIATGRTHQIRVHMKSVGAPVLGDALYGNARINQQYGASHQLLHASVMRFQHPIHGNEMEFVAEPDNNMNQFINKLLSR